MNIISSVEQKALERSGQKLIYSPVEKIGVIVVDNFPALGKLAALRFLEWVRKHPDGVVSLPTGKTPEFFIKEVRRFMEGWDDLPVQEELEASGIEPAGKVSFEGLRFVQIDEFYPISPLQHNSFYHYVNSYYLKGFGMNPGNAMLIDCSTIGIPRGKTLEEIWPDDEVDLSLRYRPGHTRLERQQKEVLERIDQWCIEYEDRIRSMGGIGFFLGGIGPDGHIGFNIRGSDLYSTTRLAVTNYETQAAAASDLGGIEVARRRLVITIGLATITYNPDCIAIIMAAGESKARIVADSIQSERHIRNPASVLQGLKASRFYLTIGAADLLRARQRMYYEQAEHLSDIEIERAVIDLSLKLGKKITAMDEQDFKSEPLAAEVFKIASRQLSGSGSAVERITSRVSGRLMQKIEAGIRIRRDCAFLHTEPHHDDLMLGYLPYIVRHIREASNRHFFATLTSGFTAVTNIFMLNQLKKLKSFIQSSAFTDLSAERYFRPGSQVYRNRDVWQYLDGVAAGSRAMQDDGEMRRLYRNMVEVFEERDLNILTNRINELISYFETQYPGKRDLDYIQKLKGMCREWEADCLWGYFGWNSESVRHLRLGFYRGEVFTEEPSLGRDVQPILDLLREIRPDVVSLALDPEASGPDTHYKVMQAVTEALRIYYEKENGADNIRILGYRNVWYRYHPSEADLFIPVSLNMFSLQYSAFMNTFISQKEASFPSYEHDGPFPELAQKIQVEQYQMLKTCLGREFFYEHSSALFRAARGLVFLKEMSLEELYSHSRELRRSTENL